MERIIELSMLIDFYGGLLTDKQFEIIDLYHNNDYSLSEISEMLGITRQGVYDSLKRAQNTLYSYEEKLQLVNKFVIQNDTVKDVILKLKTFENTNFEINECIEALETILDND